MSFKNRKNDKNTAQNQISNEIHKKRKKTQVFWNFFGRKKNTYSKKKNFFFSTENGLKTIFKHFWAKMKKNIFRKIYFFWLKKKKNSAVTPGCDSGSDKITDSAKHLQAHFLVADIAQKSAFFDSQLQHRRKKHVMQELSGQITIGNFVSPAVTPGCDSGIFFFFQSKKINFPENIFFYFCSKMFKNSF